MTYNFNNFHQLLPNLTVEAKTYEEAIKIANSELAKLQVVKEVKKQTKILKVENANI